jgi:hypothetical protein
MKTFQEFMIICEASEADAARQLGWGGGASIIKSGAGGRIGRERKKTTPERRRMKAVGGGKMEPVEYKPRKDIGQQRQASTRVQQPTQERGSADVKARAAAAAKEERKKAALARIAAKQGKSSTPAASKPSGREAEKTATKLLSAKKPEAEKPASTAPKKPPSGKTRAERDKERNAAMRASYNKKKAEVLADYEKVHGKKPTGKEKTKLLGLINREAPAHPSSAAKPKA